MSSNLDKDGLLLWQLHGLGSAGNSVATVVPPAQPSATVSPRPITIPSDDALEIEATALFTVLVTLVTSAGHALSLGALSEGLCAKTGASWGSKWEKKHGTLKDFLSSRSIQNVHVLTRNRWFSLQGMVVPSVQEDAILLAPVLRPIPVSSPQPLSQPLSNQQVMLNSAATFQPFSPQVSPQNTVIVEWDPFATREDNSIVPVQQNQFQFQQSHQQSQSQTQQLQRTRSDLDRLRLEARKVEDDALLRQQRERENKRRADLQAEEEDTRIHMAKKLQESEDEKLACAIAQEEHERTFSANSAIALDSSHGQNLSAFSAPGSGLGSGRGSYQSRYNSLFADESPSRRNGNGRLSPGRQQDSSTVQPLAMSQLAIHRSAYDSFGSMSSSSMSQQRSLSTSLSARQQHYRDRSGGGSTEDQQTLASYGGGGRNLMPRIFPGPSIIDTGVDDSDSTLLWSDFDLLFRPILFSGFVLIKHDRSGGSQKRRFYCDTDLIALRWSSSRLSDLFTSGERSIDLATIVGVLEGISTDLLKKKLQEGQIFGGHAERFFSLILPSRTLDLEAASSTQAKVLARAFRFLSRARNRAGVSPSNLVAAARRGSARF